MGVLPNKKSAKKGVIVEDYSSAIAAVSVLVEVLAFLSPGGEWEELPELVPWREARYSLTLATYQQLTQQLTQHYDQALASYHYSRRAGHKLDPNRIQLQLPLWEVGFYG